jgi:hypothetical protein
MYCAEQGLACGPHTDFMSFNPTLNPPDAIKPDALTMPARM